MKEALFYEKLKKGLVQCHLCNHNCLIPEGKRGICGVRKNQDGKLYSLVYGKACAAHVDPIEKKPLFQFMPGSSVFSIATVGCNFKCLHCQNWEISQPEKIEGEDLPPEKIVELAKETGCQGIAYTYTEPTVFYEYAFDTMKLAKKARLCNLWVSNGYIQEKPLRKIAKLMDGINIDLKFSSDNLYKEVCGARLQPVLDTIKLCHELGIWTEITTLIIPGYNDSSSDIKKISEYLFAISPDMPIHFSAYHPSYKMAAPPTPFSTLEKAVEIAKKVGLKYVYAGNVFESKYENTQCPKCGKNVIERNCFTVTKMNLKGNKCKFCKQKIDGVF